jgi:hypothetical protein
LGALDLSYPLTGDAEIEAYLFQSIRIFTQATSNNYMTFSIRQLLQPKRNQGFCMLPRRG